MLTLNIQTYFKGLPDGDYCIQRYKCDPVTHVCSETSEPLSHENVYGSICECMEACGCLPCETEGCIFQAQFYYLEEWGRHACDYAVYDAYVGARLLGEVNLNNGSDGGSRYSDWFTVEMSDFNPTTCAYYFKLVCKLGYCHTGISGLRFKYNDVIVLDLPQQSGDSWGVCADDICEPAP